MNAPMSSAGLGPSGTRPVPGAGAPAGQDAALWAVLALSWLLFPDAPEHLVFGVDDPPFAVQVRGFR